MLPPRAAPAETAPPAGSAPAWSSATLAGDPHADPEKARRVQAMFGAIARRYDLNNTLHSFGQDERWRRRTVKLSGAGPGSRVLDVACGTGRLTEAFAGSGATQVTGVDFTPQMLEIARERSGRLRRRSGAAAPTFEEGDAMSLRFADASFDVLSIAFGIRNVSDPAAALREFMRLLSPGGRVAILEFDEPTSPLLRPLARFYTRHVMPITASLIARDRSGAYRYLPRSVATFTDRAGVAALLAREGFTAIRQHPLTCGICVVTIAEKPRV